MSFIWPPMLLSLALIPAGVWLYGRIGARRQLALSRAFGSAVVDRGRPVRRTGTSRVATVLVVLGLAVAAVALARPQAVVALPRNEGTVILAFDVSDSMAATDIAPTRIAAAKAAAKDFVAAQPPGIAVGVVAFSDAGVAVQTPSTDQVSILNAIDQLAPKKGTSVAAGISASLGAIAAAARGPYGNDYYSNTSTPPEPTPAPTPVPPGYHAPAVIVLLSDGENNENPNPLTVAQDAANQGVRIFTVGIGTAGGADIDVEGVHVHTQLDAATLQQIADLTGGTYYAATDAAQLRAIYSHLDTQLVARPELTELTAMFGGAGLLLLFGGGMLSLLSAGRLP